MIPGHDQLELLGTYSEHAKNWYWCKRCKKAVEPVEVQEEEDVYLCCPNCLLDDLGEEAFMAIEDAIEAPPEGDEEEEEVLPVIVTEERPWDESIDTSADDDDEFVPPQVNDKEYEYT